MKHSHRTLIALSLLALGSCISSQSYVDPQFRGATLGDISRPPSPHRVQLQVEFQRNGDALPAADAELRSAVVAALEKTGATTIVAQGGEITIRVLCNNLADLASARARGFGTGLTFGLAGSTVSDFYEFRLESRANGTTTTRDYKHAIHTTVGNAPAPVQGVEPSSAGRAFPQVVEDVILNFVSELQASNRLTLRVIAGAPLG